VFHQLFALNELKLDKATAGDAFALALFVSLPLFFVMGWLSDRFHPVRIVIVGMALLAAASMACYFFIHDAATFRTWTVVWTLAQTTYLGGQISLMPRMMPREEYGQYCSANNTLCAIGKIRRAGGVRADRRRGGAAVQLFVDERVLGRRGGGVRRRLPSLEASGR
jgi:MFS family permease